jgi:glycosyltransferase involved in cell wall biosynthesis
VKVLVVHASYRQRGGEDAAVERELALLRACGHAVVEYRRSNAEPAGVLGPLGVAARALWSQRAVRELRALAAREAPDVAHVHNAHFAISPAALRALHGAGVPVVQTLHNYRLLCGNALLYRDGGPCEDCVGRRLGWPGVWHGCFRGSRLQSAGVAAVGALHAALGTWRDCVDRFVALTQFQLEKLVLGGIPREKLCVKPNFVDPPPRPRSGLGEYALFAGRLAPEKGVATLLRALELAPGVSARVAGDGPLAGAVHAAAERRTGLSALGWRSADEVQGLLARARCLVVPSQWYEGFPLAIVEAFAAGVPVVASRIGSLAELVEHGATGLLVTPGDAGELASALEWAWKHPEEMALMGARARRVHAERYSAERSHERLLEIYAAARASHRSA